MRIVFLTSSLGAGGAERVATTLCNTWAARGDSVTLIPTFSGGGTPFYDVSKQVDLMFLASVVKPGKFKILNYFKRLFTLRRIIMEKHADVVVSFLPNVNVAAILATSFTKVPLIVCERSDPAAQPIPWYWKIACKVTYPFADMLTVQSETVVAKAKMLFKGVKCVEAIPNPLPEGVLRYERQNRSGRKILLSLGRLSAEKQVGKIISAFAELSAARPEWDLHVYGAGRLRDDLQRQIQQLNLSDRVFLKGNTDDPWGVMAGSDAYVLASSYEGFPNAMLEAMGVGLPCVAFDCPSGPAELSEDGTCAVLVKLDDQQELAKALSDVLTDEAQRKALGDRARSSIRRRFGLPSIIARWDDMFRKVGAVR